MFLLSKEDCEYPTFVICQICLVRLCNSQSFSNLMHCTILKNLAGNNGICNLTYPDSTILLQTVLFVLYKLISGSSLLIINSLCHYLLLVKNIIGLKNPYKDKRSFEDLYLFKYLETIRNACTAQTSLMGLLP